MPLSIKSKRSIRVQLSSDTARSILITPRGTAKKRAARFKDFMRLKDQTATAQELYDRMLALYPDRINLSVSVAKGDSEPGWAASYWIVSLRTARPGKGMSLVQSD